MPVRAPESTVDLDGPRQIGHGLLQPPELKVREASVVVGVSVPWVELDGPT